LFLQKKRGRKRISDEQKALTKQLQKAGKLLLAAEKKKTPRAKKPKGNIGTLCEAQCAKYANHRL
jgi:hypothetical protein